MQRWKCWPKNRGQEPAGFCSSRIERRSTTDSLLWYPARDASALDNPISFESLVWLIWRFGHVYEMSYRPCRSYGTGAID